MRRRTPATRRGLLPDLGGHWAGRDRIRFQSPRRLPRRKGTTKTDANGRRWATIRMGADDVTVEADKLTAKDGAAMVNMTQAQLNGLAKKPST